MMSTIAMDNGAKIAPDYMVKLAGSDITTDISKRLISLLLTDNRGFEADQLDIELDDADGLMQMPPRGAVLSVFLGWKGQALFHKGEFTVDEVEHRGAPDTLTLRARSADYRGSLNSRRDNSYHDTTLEAIVSAIAARNSLQPAVAESLKGVKVSHIDQTQETDAAFITRLAELNGGVVAIKAGKLIFIKPGSALTASGKPIPQITLSRSDGDGHTFNIADRDAYTGVSATWLHTKEPKPKKVKVQRKKKEKHLRALQHPAAKKTTAKAQKAPETKEGEYLVGNDENVFALTTVYATQKAAMRAAQAKWDKLQRGVAQFSISLARGRADLFPETPLAVSGFKAVIDAQPWLISKVTHSLNNGGYTTGLELEVLLSDVSYEATENN
ncbi:phage late control D family protein [Rahnella variigena]|uniref:phage late control D family protein n=1 Tax=Rahnella variigena TaxID=574964 RepID=UPI00244828BC|nr:phage late control D family protein [Rahnella variigena]MDH2897324.1 phage late control D family protein [Rahnella variigena]